MIDAAGRTIDHLRISVTNRCNLDCFYCHKEGNGNSIKEMTTEQIGFILQEARKTGIETIKFTGGEPLLRDDIVQIVRLANTLGFSDISLTSNGTLLDRYAEKLKLVGLERVNIGCDSLTGVLPKNTGRLKNGIIAAKKAGLDVKLNMVALKGINEMQIPDMLEFCTNNSVNLQLIELIECGNDYERYFYPLDSWEKLLAAKASKIITRDMQRRKRYTIGDIFVETVRPRKEFCEKCNKIRITADGRIRQCLMKNTGIIDFKNRQSIEIACRMRDGYGYD
jgi:cyclic pyranopterin phosphate synthase